MQFYVEKKLLWKFSTDEYIKFSGLKKKLIRACPSQKTELKIETKPVSDLARARAFGLGRRPSNLYSLCNINCFAKHAERGLAFEEDDGRFLTFFYIKQNISAEILVKISSLLLKIQTNNLFWIGMRNLLIFTNLRLALTM